MWSQKIPLIFLLVFQTPSRWVSKTGGREVVFSIRLREDSIVLFIINSNRKGAIFLRWGQFRYEKVISQALKHELFLVACWLLIYRHLTKILNSYIWPFLATIKGVSIIDFMLVTTQRSTRLTGGRINISGEHEGIH